MQLEIRGAQQTTNTEGDIEFRPMRVVVRGRGGKLTTGKVKAGSSMDTKITLTTLYILIEVDGKTVVELDKLNEVYKVNGVDVLAKRCADMSDEKRMDTALLAENDENTAAEENALVMKLDKPFTFEGQTYTEVDLSGLEDTTAADLQAVGRFVTKKNPAANPATVEMTLEYAQFMAARVAHLPLEFFERLPAKEAIKLKGIVVGFLYGGAGDN